MFTRAHIGGQHVDPIYLWTSAASTSTLFIYGSKCMQGNNQIICNKIEIVFTYPFLFTSIRRSVLSQKMKWMNENETIKQMKQIVSNWQR